VVPVHRTFLCDNLQFHDHTQGFCTTSEGAGAGLMLVVATPVQQSAAASVFSYDPPVISSVSGRSPTNSTALCFQFGSVVMAVIVG
jgi:hypothetical protein